MPGNNTPITPSAWGELGEKAQWDIKAALRGPDLHDSESLKWFTTGVIRGKCRKAFRVGGSVNSDLNLVIIAHGGDWGRFNAGHFFGHVADAAGWLDIRQLHIHASADFIALITGAITRENILTFTKAIKDEMISSQLIVELERHANVLKGGW